MRSTMYRKNIRQWEQWSRVVAGMGLLAATLAVSSAIAKVLFVVGGLAMIITGFVGWCPACAMVGRSIEQGGDRVSR